MVKDSWEKCGKEFTQKGHYTQHITKKKTCVFESKIEEMIEKGVANKIDDITSNASTIISSAIINSISRWLLVNVFNFNLASKCDLSW